MSTQRSGELVRVCVEVPRGSFIKREAGRGIEFISPLPCPFNYGCLPDTLAPDGDPPDALILGPGLPAGALVDVPVFGVVHFLDGGVVDDKLICGHAPSRSERRGLAACFTVYAVARRAMNRVRGIRGETRFAGIEVWAAGSGAGAD